MKMPMMKSWWRSAPFWKTASEIFTWGTPSGEILGFVNFLSFLSTETCSLEAQLVILLWENCMIAGVVVVSMELWVLFEGSGAVVDCGVPWGAPGFKSKFTWDWEIGSPWMGNGDVGATGGTVASCIVTSTEDEGICWWLLVPSLLWTAMVIEEWEDTCSGWAVVEEKLVACVWGGSKPLEK